MPAYLDLHFPDVCFAEVIDRNFFISVFTEKHSLFEDLSVDNMMTVFSWDFETYFDLMENTKKYIKGKDYIGYVERYFYEIFYIKECRLCHVSEAEWFDNIVADDREQFEEMFKADPNEIVKVVCFKKNNPDLKKFNHEYGFNNI